MSKKFGQNFLLSPEIRERIVSEMGDVKDNTIFEIGPGLGSITSLMLKKGARVKAFEIDHGFASALRDEAFKDEEGFSLIEGDALKTLKEEMKRPDLIVGNLPYNVGSVIIASIIEDGRILPEKMVFTLQKEVVERMKAKEGSKDYSSFSLLSQLDYDVRLSFVIPRSVFYPVPNVDSAVAVMTKKKEKTIDESDRPLFFTLLRALFSQRRKTIKNNLKSLLSQDKITLVLEKAGIDEKERAENLSLSDILRLLSFYKEL